jgi:hypothetical protein
VQLQQVLPALTANGVALFAISYDTVETLASFAEIHRIGYSLLSDDGSLVMRRLGLINERVQEDHAVYGIAPNPRHVNLPYPGVFVLDERGTIVQKRFHESYRERDTGPGLIAETLGIFSPRHEVGVETENDMVSVRAWLDSPTYCAFQRLHLVVELAIAPGLHVYGSPTPEAYVPLGIEVTAIPGMDVKSGRWPSSRPFRVPGLNEQFLVHEGTVRGLLPLVFTAPPGAGDHVIKAIVRYQLCSASTCWPPATIPVELPVREVVLAGRSLPAARS